MESAGLTTAQAATVFIPQMLGTIASGFVWAWLTDRTSPRLLLVSCQASLLAAHLSYAWVKPGFGAALYSTLLGINGGSIRALASALYPKWFGTDHIGGIRGVATAFGVGASAVGPLIVAVGFSHWGLCHPQLFLGAGARSSNYCSLVRTGSPQGNVFSFAVFRRN